MTSPALAVMFSVFTIPDLMSSDPPPRGFPVRLPLCDSHNDRYFSHSLAGLCFLDIGISMPVLSRFLPPLAEVITVLQHAAIWRYLDLERRPTDKEGFPSRVRHCGTRCHSLFVTHL